ncbi:tryptophan 2,3-dioxygenase family protein [Streptosporangium sp. NPDC000396]|uniref:tryptophan 2,3-dioxygenase family protein n=1 Tax=Streptosporangium sp. NPDC000396 TaxID=3366185 RepID=UPI0036CAD584
MTDGRAVEAQDGMSYGGYLRLPDLLDAQQPVSPLDAHDELLFIIAHQVHELWFKLLLHELTAARDAMLAGEVHRPRLLLARCRVAEQLMVSQIDLLDTLHPTGFLEFRSELGTASGFQSTQFREIEFLSGWKDARYAGGIPGLADADQERLRCRLGEPCLWEAFLTVLAGAGFTVTDEGRRRDALLTIAKGASAHRELWDLAESLIDHDQAWSLWRSRHALMVERQIGTKAGTGGGGLGYLRARQHRHFYPELWEVRSQL